MNLKQTTLVAVVLVGATLLLAACSTTAPAPSSTSAPAAVTAPSTVATPATTAQAETGDSAFMTVYRKKRIVGLALNTSVYVDGTEIAELDPGTYVKVRLSPGAHRVWADEEDDALTVTAEAGKTYFFRMELVPGLWKGHGRMIAVDDATGSKEFAEYQCRLAADIKVPAMVGR